MKKRNIFIGNIVKNKKYTVQRISFSDDLVQKVEESSGELIKKNAIFIKKYGYYIDIDDITNFLDLILEDYNYTCYGRHVLPIYKKIDNKSNESCVDIIDNYFNKNELNENISISKLKKKILIK